MNNRVFVFIDASNLWQAQKAKGRLFDYEKWILNFPTKIRWYNPSKIEYIELGLNAIVKLNEKLFLDSVAFPKIGSGLGGLDWIDVKKLIIKILSPLDLKIEVYE